MPAPFGKLSGQSNFSLANSVPREQRPDRDTLGTFCCQCLTLLCFHTLYRHLNCVPHITRRNIDISYLAYVFFIIFYYGYSDKVYLCNGRNPIF